LKVFADHVKYYLALTKPRQTGLLLFTGLAGYLSGRCPVLNLPEMIGLLGSLLLAISGCTALNMVYDRDIDARMGRTADRPLPAGRITVRAALGFGVLLIMVGLAWAFILSPLFALVIAAGLFFDLVVYTIWLKRRSAWCIIWGGIAGGMPILAGRTLAIGWIDPVGGMLALAVLLWIPTHILTSVMHYFEDYRSAGIPSFPAVYGFKNTRLAVGLAGIGTTAAVGIGFAALGISWGYLQLLALLSACLIGLALVSILRPCNQLNLGLFKFASLYMLGAMVMLMVGGYNTSQSKPMDREGEEASYSREVSGQHGATHLPLQTSPIRNSGSLYGSR